MDVKTSDAFRRSLSWVRSIMGRLHSSGPGLYFRISSKKQSRAVATATLFGVVLSAAIAFTLAPGLKAVATLPATQSTGPIRMVGGAPRSNVCDEQVWPYIEDRCRHAKIGSK